MTYTEEETEELINICVKAAKTALLNTLLNDSAENIHQLRGAIFGHLEILESGDE